MSVSKYVIIIVTKSKMTEAVYQNCKDILNHGNIPVILTNTTPLHMEYHEILQKIMKLSDDIMVFEAAKVATRRTMVARAKLFIESNKLNAVPILSWY